MACSLTFRRPTPTVRQTTFFTRPNSVAMNSGNTRLIGELLTKPVVNRRLIPLRVKALPVLAGQPLDGVGLKPQPPPFRRPGLARSRSLSILGKKRQIRHIRHSV